MLAAVPLAAARAAKERADEEARVEATKQELGEAGLKAKERMKLKRALGPS